MRFRSVGVNCDADKYDPLRHMCDTEIVLYGGATYSAVDKEARREGWWMGDGRTHADRRYLCPHHKHFREKQ